MNQAKVEPTTAPPPYPQPQPGYPPQPEYPPQQGYPPQPGYAPQYPQGQQMGYPPQGWGAPQMNNQMINQSTVIVQAAAPVVVHTGGHYCPTCDRHVTTYVFHKIGGYAVLMCFIFALILPAGCCFIPFCINSYKDAHHYCPHCDRTLFVTRRC